MNDMLESNGLPGFDNDTVAYHMELLLNAGLLRVAAARQSDRHGVMQHSLRGRNPSSWMASGKIRIGTK